ncbi:MAG TPA: phosphodiester glycosidase family protein [Candidatus Onthousia excrementipullorum]|uniref:Phosphodiester glycosidase family protein n=1 Tax=Candidatus Onthousia excrementipullorum TaxID=2840884 RepID=A0A9D1DT10_9FIRM|nr:phosphodiester glycosidase family protein [Candidatus Onthousia excrementipullorum]
MNRNDLDKTILMPSIASEIKKEKRKEKSLVTKVIIALFIIGSSLSLFLFYGPISGFRNFWITSAMTSMSHQYLATWFYNDDVINEVLSNNHIIEVDENTNPDLINFKDYDTNAKIYKNEYEKQILTKDPGNDLYKVIEVSGSGYQGYLVAIYDPSRVSIATTAYLGKRGEAITTVAKRENAVIAINAGGFYDPDWNSNGALPHGTVIQNGKIVSDFEDAQMGGGFVGFTKDNKLVLAKMTKEEALDMGMRDAIEFGPFLIVNGKSSFVKGNGGWGIAPRTAIGQREDGIVLFLVINGRLATSIGADMGDLTEIMENYGAVNAANMDGGSSSALVINNKIINTPVAGGKDGLRDIPTFWIVK